MSCLVYFQVISRQNQLLTKIHSSAPNVYVLPRLYSSNLLSPVFHLSLVIKVNTINFLQYIHILGLSKNVILVSDGVNYRVI